MTLRQLQKEIKEAERQVALKADELWNAKELLRVWRLELRTHERKQARKKR